MKKSLCILLALALLLGCAACGSRSAGGRDNIRIIATLVEQDYSLAFRVDDPTQKYIDAALKVLMANGTVDELTDKWLGERIIRFDRDLLALEKLSEKEEIAPRDLIVGVDVNSFPMAYLTDKGAFWGFDIQLAMAATDLLGWNLKLQPIAKEEVYIELSSGNIDVAWGGIALNEKELKEGLYSQLGPYVHNDIVIAARSGSFIYNTLMLSGKRLVMNSTTEAMDALNVDPRLARRLGQITRMAKGTAECFQALGEGKCDVVLADSTAVCHFNHR